MFQRLAKQIYTTPLINKNFHGDQFRSKPTLPPTDILPSTVITCVAALQVKIRILVLNLLSPNSHPGTARSACSRWRWSRTRSACARCPPEARSAAQSSSASASTARPPSSSAGPSRAACTRSGSTYNTWVGDT